MDIVDILTRRGGFRALAISRPRSIASFRLTSGLKLEQPHFSTVIDGGANVGQFARAVSSAYPGCCIYSFEPLPDVALKLRNNLADVIGHVVFENAIGNRDGEIDFRRCSDDQSSSVLPRIEYSGSLLQGTGDAGVETVRICRLDQVLLGQKMVPPVLMKLDLQGYELEALRGATETLKVTSHVLIEAVFTKAYEGEPYFEEIWRFLNDRGFRFSRPLAFVRDRTDRIVQMDALFENTRLSSND